MALPSSKAREDERTISFGDASGFAPLPFVARTSAPCGETAVWRAPLTRDHVSVISGVTSDGRLFVHSQEQADTGATIVDFLRQVLRQIPGKLLVVWDGAIIHRCQVVKALLSRGAAARLQVERLPGDAPELHPDEGVWNLLTRGERKNRCCQTMDELRWQLGLAIRRLRRKRHLLQACFRECGYG